MKRDRASSRQILDDLGGKVDLQLKWLQQLDATEIMALNVLLRELGLPPIFVPPPAGENPSPEANAF